MSKPIIIVLNARDGDDRFDWMSDGWNAAAQRGDPEAARLLALAKRCIADGADVLAVIANLERAGFEVLRQPRI